MTRVAITGLGAVCGFGRGLASFHDGVWSGRTAIEGPGPIPGRGPVAALDGGPHLTSDLALDAVREALGALSPGGVGLVGGSTSGDMVWGEDAYARWHTTGEVGDGFFWSQLCDRPTAIVASTLGFSGPRITLSTACTSGAAAAGTAAGWITRGVVQAAVAFGADALCGMTVHGFGSLGSVAPEPCRPFDAHRHGLSLGDGAGAVLLESEAHAARRGAEVLGWLVGYGNATDAHHMTAPHPEGRGARAAIAAALGSRDPAEIGWVCAHGTGTPLNDAMEAGVLGDLGAPVSGLKGAIGHTLGAAGALELVATVLALRTGALPPTAGLANPGFDLDLVTATRAAHPEAALSVNFAFGGNNTALLVQRCG